VSPRIGGPLGMGLIGLPDARSGCTPHAWPGQRRIPARNRILPDRTAAVGQKWILQSLLPEPTLQRQGERLLFARCHINCD
jgi:hypothetical protein